jgi:hypothetical protein
MRHISYPETPQFRSIVRQVEHLARFQGVGEDGEVKYSTDDLPTIKFKGTVKIHGTNASVAYDTTTKNMWVQSRNQVVESGHFGFKSFVDGNQEAFSELFESLLGDIEEPSTISIYGEWCGPGVIKGCSVAELDNKIFVMFGVYVEIDGETSYWLDVDKLKSENDSIYNINDFKTYEMDINFENPKLSINDMIELTNEVEKECPVAKHFGFSTIGEGIVWTATYKGTRLCFKVKGEKHSNTKVKKLATVDVEKLKNIDAACDYLFTENRLDQAIHETQSKLDRKYTGEVLKWICGDIMKEENDVLESNGLKWKDVAGRLTAKYRNLFFKKIDEDIFN